MTPEQMAHVEWVLATILTDDDGAPIRALITHVTTLQQEKAALETALKEFGWTLPAGSVAPYHNWYPAFVEERARAEQAESRMRVAEEERDDFMQQMMRAAGRAEQAEATTRRLEHERDVADRSGREFAEEARRLREALVAARRYFTDNADNNLTDEYVRDRIDAALATTPPTADPEGCMHARTTCHACGTTFTQAKAQAR